MILVGGATGQLGTAVVRRLLEAGAKGRFSVLARDAAKAGALVEQGVEVRVADFDQPHTLPAAFAGIDSFLFISTMSPDRAAQQIRVVDAAANAGVKHIVYTGLGIRDIQTSGVRGLMMSHFQTEIRIRTSGMTHTFLRNTMYAEAIAQIIGPQALMAGISLPGGRGRVPYAVREELGEAAANVLLQGGHVDKTYYLTGAAAYGYADIARELSRLGGRALAYRDITPEALRARLQAEGLPAFLIHLTIGTLQDIRAGQYEVGSDDLERLLGRRPKDLAGMLRHVFPDIGAQDAPTLFPRQEIRDE